MSSKRSWNLYPDSYRAREIKVMAGWVQAGESGSIVGLAGAGKSNLLGFLSHQPDILRQYLPADAPKLVVVQIDLNNMPNHDLSTFYRIILRSLFESADQLTAFDPSLKTTIEALYRKVEEKTDPFLSQSALREALLLLRAQEIRQVFVFDPFDHFCRTATTQVLDNLRGLRDTFKTTLSYIVGLRHELAYIRDPVELGELYEILDIHQCWLGPMARDDAHWVVDQIEAATGQGFSKAEKKQLVELTGGYPALLKAASLWLTRHKLAKPATVPKLDDWAEQLLSESSIQNRLQDLRSGLTGEEEAALSILQLALNRGGPDQAESIRQIEEKHQLALQRLQAKGLCRKSAAGWHIFSPLFAKFVAKMQGVSAGKIWMDEATTRFFRGDTEFTGLSEKDRRLMELFLTNPLSVHTIDDLIEAAWLEDDSSGVSDGAVQQAIRHLRKQIEPNPAKPCYLINERGVGYRFFAEGAPRQ